MRELTFTSAVKANITKNLQNLEILFLKIEKQKLDGMNIIIKLKFQNHGNTFEVTSTSFLHGLSFQMLQKTLKPERNYESGDVTFVTSSALFETFHFPTPL